MPWVLLNPYTLPYRLLALSLAPRFSLFLPPEHHKSGRTLAGHYCIFVNCRNKGEVRDKDRTQDKELVDVNISVSTADPVMRESLASSKGEPVSQDSSPTFSSEASTIKTTKDGMQFWGDNGSQIRGKLIINTLIYRNVEHSSVVEECFLVIKNTRH